MSIKVRLTPKDDYSTSQTVEISAAVRREFERSGEARCRALRLVFCALVDSGVIGATDLLDVLNAGRKWEETEWEIVP